MLQLEIPNSFKREGEWWVVGLLNNIIGNPGKKPGTDIHK
jgi:hypothetical protein